MSEYTSFAGEVLLEGTEVEFDLFLKTDSEKSSNYVLIAVARKN